MALHNPHYEHVWRYGGPAEGDKWELWITKEHGKPWEVEMYQQRADRLDIQHPDVRNLKEAKAAALALWRMK